AVVPTYNEASRIAAVLQTLCTSPDIAEVIVVDDGSTDNTAEVVGAFDVRYIPSHSNQGKGAAMEIGVQASCNAVIFFADADVTGLTHDMIHTITNPVVRGDVDMFIGMRNRKIYYLQKIIIFVPLAGGERAVTRRLWNTLPNYYKHRFRVEVGLNFFAQYYGNGFRFTIIKGLKQVVKEKKYGLLNGLLQRFKMVLNIITAQIKLQFVHVPKSAKNRRLLALVSVQSLVGLGIGIMLVMAAYYGPADFISLIFSEELQEDPGALFPKLLLRISRATAWGTLLSIGAFIAMANLISFLLTAKNLLMVFRGIKSKIDLQE
ncbi:MAG: hypothetical protein CO132_03950, partial [Candidatus Kerfeldbacteria bacterium CG_4_9_14_3_um_filter_45_8]